MSEDHAYLRRNFVSLAGDWVAFVVAMAFVSYTSVIPSFVNRLTDFAPLIGLVTTVANGAWLLPQLVSANYVASKQRKKPYVILFALIGRPSYLVVALAIFLTGGAYPWLLLTTFFLAEAVFSVTDGLSSVAWFDIVSKSIPSTRRGRFYSTAQIIGGLLAMAAGLVVREILGPRGPTFPHNYGLLFVIAVAFLLVSLASFSRVKEPAERVEEQRDPWRVYLPRLLGLLRKDRQYRLVNIVRLLAGLGWLALPFYVVYATDVLGIAEQNLGLFVSGQVMGGIVASLAMGYLNERSGSKIVTQLTIGLGLSIPVLALLIHFRPPHHVAASYVYAVVFVLIGANYSGYMQGFTNLVMDMSPGDQRPTYVGLYNTLAGTVLVLPLLGGWLLQTTSYPVLFAAAAAGSMASLALSFLLTEPRGSG